MIDPIEIIERGWDLGGRMDDPADQARLSEAVDQYLTQTLYTAIPQQILFDFDGFSIIN